ncbi:MAG: hypothetical protein WAV07_04370 [Candidatus Contendobacter sp.]
MTNPWLKKNPFMSLWLSGANAVAGSMRGHAAAQAKRQTAAATTNATRGILNLWTGALAPSPPAKRKKNRR